MKITIWNRYDENKKVFDFNHYEEGWVDTEFPLPIFADSAGQVAWVNHTWKREYGYLVGGVVTRKGVEQ